MERPSRYEKRGKLLQTFSFKTTCAAICLLQIMLALKSLNERDHDAFKQPQHEHSSTVRMQPTKVSTRPQTWLRKTYRVPRLHKDSAWSSELAHETFPRRQTRNNTSRSDPLKDVFSIPSHQMAIVNDVSFALRHLLSLAPFPLPVELIPDLHPS